MGRYSEKKYVPILNDMDGHWLTTQGWTDAALYSGMVVPDDYNGKNFRPEKEIARYEIALMTDRALGLVYPANQYAGEDLPFADNGEILDWMKGYVHEAGPGRHPGGLPRQHLPSQPDLHPGRGGGDDSADAP